MRISGVFENTECSFLYDEKGKVVLGYIFPTGKTGEACLRSLAKVLKNKYPNITAPLPELTKYGFLKTNIILTIYLYIYINKIYFMIIRNKYL